MCHNFKRKRKKRNNNSTAHAPHSCVVVTVTNQNTEQKKKTYTTTKKLCHRIHADFADILLMFLSFFFAVGLRAICLQICIRTGANFLIVRCFSFANKKQEKQNETKRGKKPPEIQSRQIYCLRQNCTMCVGIGAFRILFFHSFVPI